MKKSKIIFEALKETIRKSIHISIDNTLPSSVCDSKIGGEFYFPKGAKLPLSTANAEMEFIAQINFSQLPELPDYPKHGILQFFMDTRNEIMEEMDSAELSESGIFKVVYYKEVQPQLQQTLSFWDFDEKDRYQLKPCQGKMQFTLTEEVASLGFKDYDLASDYGTEEVLYKITPNLVKQAGFDLTLCSDTDDFIEQYGNWGIKISGHPAIRQGDIRLEDKKFCDYTELLFQYDLTTKEELEADTFLFFIKPEDLKKGCFDDILLCWHNCY